MLRSTVSGETTVAGLFHYTNEDKYKIYNILEQNWIAISNEIPPFNIDKVKIVRKRDEWYNTNEGLSLFEKLQRNTDWVGSWHDNWFSFPLMFNNNVVGDVENLCPNTIKSLKLLGNVNVAGFSLLTPHSTVPLHTDEHISLNMLLSGKHSHISIQNGTSFDTTYYKYGEVLIFNSKIPHAARNDGDENRVILFIDIS
jgi:aspartyl/asparaginyl beta-hydroxylase (cupin superfamily)